MPARGTDFAGAEGTTPAAGCHFWGFPKIGGTHFWGSLYKGNLFCLGYTRGTPILGNARVSGHVSTFRFPKGSPLVGSGSDRRPLFPYKTPHCVRREAIPQGSARDAFRHNNRPVTANSRTGKMDVVWIP